MVEVKCGCVGSTPPCFSSKFWKLVRYYAPFLKKFEAIIIQSSFLAENRIKSSFFSPYNNNYMVKIKKKGVYNSIILKNEQKYKIIHFSIYIYSFCRLAPRARNYAERLTMYHTLIHQTSIYRISIYHTPLYHTSIHHTSIHLSPYTTISYHYTLPSHF